MSSKRDYEDLDHGEFSEPETKRAKKHGAKSRQHQNLGTDPTWGQKYVFSNYGDATTIPAGEESDFEDDADAMAYLMSVRKQAGDIPHIVVAPKVQIGPQLPDDLESGEEEEEGEAEELEVDRSIYTNGLGDSRGYYEDGAYIGLSGENQEGGAAYVDARNGHLGSGELDKALHDAYFTSIVDRFLRLRQIVRTKPPHNANKRLSSSQRTHAPPLGPKSSTTKQWTQVIRDTDPHPLQVALISKDSVIRILRVMLSGKFLRRGDPLSERTSCWLWALLARLPDHGELNHSEIGWVRDLGRRAVLLGRSLAEMVALREELAENGLGVNDGVDESSSDEDVVAQPYPEENYASISDAESEQAVSEDAPQTAEKEPPMVEASDGEIQDDEGAPMDIESDSDEGEVEENSEDLLAAKEKLLARLNAPASDSEDDTVDKRLEMNTRATLNMLLTVAGEFYGQRDLLEFREPFAEI